jgi:hypothetical protein
MEIEVERGKCAEHITFAGSKKGDNEMNARLRTWVTVLAGMLLLCGCKAKKPAEKTIPFPNGLSEAAQRTVLNYGGAQDTQEGIPPKYWTEPIKALNPIKVYTHRVNVVVVQRVHEGIEEGKYIVILISSYHPHPGDDGFEFSPNPLSCNKYTLGDGVFDYRRTLSKQ